MALQTQTYSVGDYAWKSWSNAYVISLTLTEESVDIEHNTSLMSYVFTISNTDNNRFNLRDFSWTINIGGHIIPINNYNFDLSNNFTTQTIASGQISVAHSSDGTLNMPFNVGIPGNMQSYISYAPPALNITGNMPLTPITAGPNSIPVVFNGVQLNSVVFNGQAVSHLVFNGATIF